MNLDQCTYDYLPGTNIYLYQHPEMFHVNTDTALLGQFMNVRRKDVVMDIGTNNGALLLYAMQQGAKQYIGVEIDPNACELARYNCNELHHLAANFFAQDILTFHHEPVSCIVCNPPFFQRHEQNPVNRNEHLSRARHETHLRLDVLIPKISTLLQDRGRLYMIHRSERLIDLALLCRAHQMEIKKLQFVYDESKTEATSVLMEAMKQGKPHCRILEPIIIHR